MEKIDFIIRLLRRLVALALKTGSFTALTAVVAAIAYADDINSNGMSYPVSSLSIGIALAFELTLDSVA
jgi:hypothetical protein